MVITTHHIPYKYGDVVKIKPLFDVHWGNKYCDKRAFKAFLADSDEHTYFFGGGDLMDSIVVPDKRYEKHADGIDSDAIVDGQINEIYEVLEPYKDRILGIGKGNHENAIIKRCGTDPSRRLCERLGCPCLGLSGMIRLVLRDNGGRGRAVIIRWHHGWGGGSRTQGADLTKFARDCNHWDADVFLYGHVHRKQSDRVPRMKLVGERLKASPKLLGICGTFLRTYSKNEDTTYSELKGYPPVEIGGICVNIKPKDVGFDAWIDV